MSDREILAENSYQEMINISKWFLYYGPIPIIIGGWAVFIYNSYYGSVDIDIVGPGLRGAMSYVLTEYQAHNQYEEVPIDDFGFSKSFKKEIYSNGKHIGDIEIDACTYEQDFFTFRENEEKKLPYSICSNNENLVEITLNANAKIYIPKKTILLLYKIKAHRDRLYTVREKRAILSSDRLLWLEGKVQKDGSDIMALLDPYPSRYIYTEGFNLILMNDIIEKYDLHFMLETLENLHTMHDSLELYPEGSAEKVKEWAEEILDYFK